MLLKGNCLDLLKTLPDCSVDSVVTDPPYELAFMGKGWDASGIAYSVELWSEVLRVLKPGGHLLAFGGTRTYHRLAVAIEDAGFEIRDSIHWSYGSGFPKSLDISKAIDKQRKEDKKPRVAVTSWVADECERLGWTRKKLCTAWGVVNQPIQSWTEKNPDYAVIPTWDNWLRLKEIVGFGDEMDAEVWRLNGNKGQPGSAWFEREVTGQHQNGNPIGIYEEKVGEGNGRTAKERRDAPSTPEAQQWAGWGSALKPSHEPIVVARKPLDGTLAANTLKWGVGGLNIDGTRVGRALGDVSVAGNRTATFGTQDTQSGGDGSGGWEQNNAGRWPANTILTHSPDCEQVGTAEDTRTNAPASSLGNGKTMSGGPAQQGRETTELQVTVPVWSCVPGCPVRELDGQSGPRGAFAKASGPTLTGESTSNSRGVFNGVADTPFYNDTGGASRFFTQTTYTEADWPVFLYYAKASKRERNAGLGELPIKRPDTRTETGMGTFEEKGVQPQQNFHPTVKPVELMRHLIRLVTPPGGTVLDPFLGSGTTAVAAILERANWIGCEMTEDYWPIIEGRTKWAEEQIEGRLL